jgi:uncharacterized membrane protein YbhN (UPF0104 family)
VDAVLGSAWLLLAAALLTGLDVLGRSSRLDWRLSSWTSGAPRWVTLVAASLTTVAALFFTSAALATLRGAVIRHLANGAAAALAALAATSILIASPARSALQAKPAAFAVDTVLVAFAISSEATRWGRWRRWCSASCALVLLTGLADGAVGPFALAAATASGASLGYLSRWALGSYSTRPGAEVIRHWLHQRGIDATQLDAVDAPGPEAFTGSLQDGTAIEVRIADRDNALSGLLRRIWSLLRLKLPDSAHAPVGSRARLRELALACLLAEQAGVHAPRALLLEPMDNRTLVLVTSRPAGPELAGRPTNAQAVSAFGLLRRLHERGLAHGYLRLGELMSVDGQVGLSSLDHSVPAASELTRRLDLVQLLAAVGQASDPDTALAAMREGYAAADEMAIASVLQPLALASWGWSAMRSSTQCLASLRSRMVPPGATVPLVRLERFRWRTVVTVAALVLVSYVLVGQLSSVNLVGALRRMSLTWFGVAVAASAVTYGAAAASLEAFLPRRLSLIRTSLVQLSTAFAGVAMPSTLGYVAVNARYLAHAEVDPTSITAAITLSQVANVVTTLATVVVLVLLTGSGIGHTRFAPGTDLLAVGAVVAAAVVLLVVVPQTRVRLVRLIAPHLRALLPRILEAITRPGRLAASVGASLLLNAAYISALLAALVALGAHPALLPTAIVYLLGNFVGSAAPTPGGLGGVEAALAAGLTGMGIPADQAIPGVVVFRLATFWLPIPAGWVAYTALRRRGRL